MRGTETALEKNEKKMPQMIKSSESLFAFCFKLLCLVGGKAPDELNRIRLTTDNVVVF